MESFVRPEVYGVMSIADVESQLRRDKMPAPFIRRMRVINLLSALTLRKIEDNMIAPFEVIDIHHVLNEQISQDAIIAMLENKNLALALKTGNLQPLWVESKEKPLLRKGFEQGWMQRFNKTPFDPICVMLAMRAKLMLDAVDELGHSYDLLKSLGMGWIDFGEIPGEEAGDPDSYIPPLINTPIDYPDLPPDPVPGDPDYVPGPGEPGYTEPYDPGPGEPGYVPGPGEPGYIPPSDLVATDPGYTTEPESPGYIPPADLTPGDPTYTTDPGSPGYIPPADLTPTDPGYTTDPGSPGYEHPWDIVPGEPGHVPDQDSDAYIAPPLRGPNDPGYGGVPGEAPGYPEGWDEGLFPGHPDYEPWIGETGYEYPSSPGGGLYGGDYGPGGSGTPGGPYGGGGDYASTVPPAPLGYGPGWLFAGRGFWGRWSGGGIDCCLDKDNPLLNVTIGYFTNEIKCGETLGLTVEQAHEDCEGDNYEWIEVNGVGSLDAETGLSVIYTAPATGANCPGNAEIWLSCGGEVVATLAITINYDYAIAFVYPDPETEIGQNDSMAINVSANGTPLTWAVSGTGFSLEHAATAGTGNVLHSDETACGAATITITDCDGNVATGFVRCTVGQWVQKSTNCDFPGVATEVNTISERVDVYRIVGNKKQYARFVKGGLSGSGLHDSCAAAAAVICDLEHECLEFELDCSQFAALDYPTLCGKRTCRTECIPYDAQYYYDCQQAVCNQYVYSEWEC